MESCLAQYGQHSVFLIRHCTFVYFSRVVCFQNSVVYKAAVGIGIVHSEGTESVTNFTWDTIDIEGLSGMTADHATWIAMYIIETGYGVGFVSNILVKNMRVRELGEYNGIIQGYNSSVEITDVTE